MIISQYLLKAEGYVMAVKHDNDFLKARKNWHFWVEAGNISE
ncbi:hypothetical protein [Okeania sp. SIO2C9]|nr:hypothetical protein [Okeania sp. SIO2C9]